MMKAALLPVANRKSQIENFRNCLPPTAYCLLFKGIRRRAGWKRRGIRRFQRVKNSVVGGAVLV